MFNFSIKSCGTLLKNQSPILDRNVKTAPIASYINLLIDKGVKGVLKRESVMNTLQELVV